MSSGSYFPAPVKAVSIPKKSGGERVLGFRRWRTEWHKCVKLQIEPDIDAALSGSYGYRRQIGHAVGVTRNSVLMPGWSHRGLFDNIPPLWLKAVNTATGHCVERPAPQQQPDGCVVPRCRAPLKAGWSVRC